MRLNATIVVFSLLAAFPMGTSLAQSAAPMTTLQPHPAAVDPAPAATAPRPDPIDALIGKPPPPITVAKWVKGEPLTGFEKGKVYVVDFWATWCGPCKAAIPHLTRLAHEHKGRVEVVGVSISEHQKDAKDTAYIEHVEKFVAKMDDRMDYRVAVDTPDKAMHDTWFKPAGTGGIPTAFIIDQKGLIAWIGIGDPKDVQRIVGEVLAGTFDIKKEKEREAAAEAEAKKRSEADIAAAKGKTDGLYAKYPGYKEAMDRGDQAAALASLDAAFKADPSSEIAAYQWKLMILLQRNKAQGEEVNAYARDLLARYPDNADIVGFVSAVIVTASDDEPRFDKALALQAAQKAAALAKPDTRWAQFTKWRLGWAYYHTGDKAKAAESMQAALDGVKKLKGKLDFGDLSDECEDALKTFAKAKK
jgi:thiol-disulfide isomerase/thioredoxin